MPRPCHSPPNLLDLNCSDEPLNLFIHWDSIRSNLGFYDGYLWGLTVYLGHLPTSHFTIKTYTIVAPWALLTLPFQR